MGLIIPRMVINMDETELRTIAQLSEFLAGALEVDFTGIDGSDAQRYAHISRVLNALAMRNQAPVPPRAASRQRSPSPLQGC